MEALNTLKTFFVRAGHCLQSMSAAARRRFGSANATGAQLQAAPGAYALLAGSQHREP